MIKSFYCFRPIFFDSDGHKIYSVAYVYQLKGCFGIVLLTPNDVCTFKNASVELETLKNLATHWFGFDSCLERCLPKINL